MKYLVEVITGSGATDRREIEARSPREAEEQARSRGLFPIRVVEPGGGSREAAGAAGAADGQAGFLDRFFRISNSDLVQLTQKLSTFLKAGLPILPAIEILRDQAPRGPLKSRLSGIARDIAAGEQIAACIEKYPRDFSSFYVASIRAGEAGGQLPEILDRLGRYLDSVNTRKRKAVTAALYPAILMAAVILVIVLVSLKYIPLVEKFLGNLRVPLPTLTAVVLEANRWLQSHALWIIFTPIVLIVTYNGFLLRYRPTRKAIHGFWLRMPGSGWLIRRSNFSWMFRTLGMLSYSGVPILNSFRVTSAVIRNDVIREEVDRIRDEVARGEPIAKTMQSGGVFDRFAVTMIDVGERSGELDLMLNRVADYYEQELDTFYLRLETVAPAVMTLVMAGVVGTVVVSLYLPILTLIDTLANRKGF